MCKGSEEGIITWLVQDATGDGAGGQKLTQPYQPRGEWKQDGGREQGGGSFSDFEKRVPSPRREGPGSPA